MTKDAYAITRRDGLKVAAGAFLVAALPAGWTAAAAGEIVARRGDEPTFEGARLVFGASSAAGQ